jgi:hypothetical protein
MSGSELKAYFNDVLLCLRGDIVTKPYAPSDFSTYNIESSGAVLAYTGQCSLTKPMIKYLLDVISNRPICSVGAGRGWVEMQLFEASDRTLTVQCSDITSDNTYDYMPIKIVDAVEETNECTSPILMMVCPQTNFVDPVLRAVDDNKHIDTIIYIGNPVFGEDTIIQFCMYRADRWVMRKDSADFISFRKQFAKCDDGIFIGDDEITRIIILHRM